MPPFSLFQPLPGLPLLKKKAAPTGAAFPILICLKAEI